MRELFTKGLEEIGIEYSASQLGKLVDFYTELSAWNVKSGFVKAEGRDLVIRHFFDSLAGIPLLAQMNFSTIADIGTGPGFPGIPLSIFFPGKQFTLIERSAKKTAFLESCKMLFALDNVTVLESELENVKGLFDAVTFRAFRNFSEYRRDLFAILPDNGFLFAYKGKMSEIEQEMAEAGIGKYRAEKISVPFMAEERHIVITVKGGNQ